MELVRTAGEAFNRQDAGVLAAISDDDLEFLSALTAVDTGGAAYRGKLWRMRSYLDPSEALEAVGLSE